MLTRVLPSSPSARPTDFDFLKVIGKGNYGKVSDMVKVGGLDLPFSGLLHPLPVTHMCKEGAYNLQIRGCRTRAGGHQRSGHLRGLVLLLPLRSYWPSASPTGCSTQ